jgi:hypothetical protein
MLTPSSRQRSYASFGVDLECHENGRRRSGAMREHRTRNLEIPGLVLTHHPE